MWREADGFRQRLGKQDTGLSDYKIELSLYRHQLIDHSFEESRRYWSRIYHEWLTCEEMLEEMAYAKHLGDVRVTIAD